MLPRYGAIMYTTRSTPIARKNHHCEVCGWDIQPGEKYELAVTFDGWVTVWKSHISPCAVATDRAFTDGHEDCGMITADDVAAWAEEHARPDDAEASELRRRLTINAERWREKREAETRGAALAPVTEEGENE